MRCDPSPEDIIKAYEKIIKDNIEYDALLQANKFDEELTEKNKEHILEKREKEKFFDAYNDFVGNAEFELNTELWDSISLEDEKNITTDSFFKVYDKYFTGGN